MSPSDATWLDAVAWNADGLVPAIAQERDSGKVLTLAWMNRAALLRTAESREAHYWSRSRGKLWRKGESSGHVQQVVDIRVDCDADALLVRVEAVGPGVCHEGYRSCFFRKLNSDGTAKITADRTFAPESVYGAEKQEKKA